MLCLTEAFLREGLFSPRLGPYKFSWLSLVGDNVNWGSTSVPGESLGFRFLRALFFCEDSHSWHGSWLLLQAGGQFF